MKQIFVPCICVLSLVVLSCTNQENKMQSSRIVSAPVVFKSYVAKNGVISDRSEAYLQMSVQDYFIKFSESDVSIEDFNTHLASLDDELKTITVEIEIRTGYWDAPSSEINEPVSQSRIGQYVIIHKIIDHDN